MTENRFCGVEELGFSFSTEFTTLLSIGAIEKDKETLRVHDFIFSARCKFRKI